MADILWPDTLPPPALNSFQETAPDNSIRSSLDRGPAKVRRRTTANVRIISFSLALDPDLVDVLDDFYNEDTFSGSVSFLMYHPRTGEQVECRFTSPPQYSEAEGVIYNASVALEILP